MNRFIYSDNGTLTDYSKELNEFDSSSVDFTWVADEDYLYIGTILPFNHFWAELSTVNATPATISVDVWWNNQWKAAVDILDYTFDTDTTFAASEIVRWGIYKDYGWNIENESKDVTGLTGTYIYDYYWSRIKFSADCTFSLKYIGQKFSDDTDLYLRYPDLNNSNLKTAFASGKTTWVDQTFIAAKNIGVELQRRGIIKSPLQLMNPHILREASCHYIAYLIYSGLGRDYADQRKASWSEFERYMHQRYFAIDLNKSGDLDPYERSHRIGYLKR